MGRIRRLFFACLVLSLRAHELRAEEANGLHALPEIGLSQLSEQDSSALGGKALALHPQEWKHGETEHFVYHYQKSHVATPVSVEAEFYFRVVTRELGKSDVPWTHKAHIYLFEQPADWESFRTVGGLEPWMGGIQSGDSLFLVRNPAFKFADNSLGHEIAHLVVFRFFGSGLPLWLNEGFAQYISKGAQASFRRARGYSAKPHSESIADERLFPVARLSTMRYPATSEVESFYNEAERLVRFLVAADRARLAEFVEVSAKGEPFERAISLCYGSRFSDLAMLESEFKVYAAKE